MTHIFLSYARKDGLTHAERLETDLIGRGYRIWRDKRGIDPARDFTAEIEKAIEAATHVVVCITPDVKRDDSFVRREVQYALLHNKPVHVARFDEVVPPIHVVNHTFCEFHKNESAALVQLCEALERPHYIPPSPPAQTADHFREYVGKVYQRAVDYLDRAVIRLIELDVADTPEAVPTRQPDMFDLLMTDQHTGESFHTFADAFQHFNGRMLLLGEPGAGKTITLMAATRDAAAARLSDPTAPLPIFGLLAVWDSLKQTPIADWLGNYDRLLTPDLVREVMADGKALLLLDGLDEMGGERTEKRKDERTGQEIEERYDPRKRFLNSLAAQLGRNRSLVTCRITDYKSIGTQAALEGGITLQKLTDAQLHDYLKDLPALQKAVETDEGLNEIARTPLLLSFFAFAFRDRNDDLKALEDLREGALRDAIFNAYMEKRYAHEERRLRLRGLGETMPFTLKEIRDMLGQVAMESMGDMENMVRWGIWTKSKSDNILPRRAFFLIMLSRKRTKSFIDICLRLEFIRYQSGQNFAFIHLLFRDTLVYSFSEKYLNNEGTYKGLNYPNPAVALGAIKDSRSLKLLQTLVKNSSGNLDLRPYANVGLGLLGDLQAIDQLIYSLIDPSQNIRSTAAYALGKLGSLQAVEPLIGVLADTDVFVRRNAVDALNKLGDPRAIRPLVHVLADTDQYTRNSAIDFLIKMGKHSVATIIEALDDPDALIRSNAATVLGRLADSRSLEPLINLLTDVDANVRGRAAVALGRLGYLQTVEPLILILADADAYVRRCVIGALGELSDPRAIDALIRVLVDPDEEIRSASARALGRLGDPCAVQALIERLDDTTRIRWGGYYTVGGEAASALNRIGTPEALAAVEAWRARGGDKR